MKPYYNRKIDPTTQNYKEETNMKPLGIIRKIDDLGRLVIPKEVRNTRGWGPGTPVEMFATEDGMSFREYRMEGDKQPALEWLEAALSDATSDQYKSSIETAIKYLKKG